MTVFFRTDFLFFKTKQKHILQYKKNPKVFRIFKIQIQWHGCGLQTSFKIYREGLATMKPEIISRETIKPSFPTPHSQIWYKLSVFDQMSYGVYIPIIQFYTSNGGDNLVDFSHRLSRLKKSLSETLTRYYALAGRIGDGGCIVFPDRSFWGWILSTKFYISFLLRYK